MSDPITIRDKYDLPCMEGKAKGEDMPPCWVRTNLGDLVMFSHHRTISEVSLECLLCGKRLTIKPDK